MDEDDVLVVAAGLFQGHQSVEDGFLVGTATLTDPLEFGDAVLVRIGLEYDFPSGKAGYADRVHGGVILESLQRIDDDRDVVHRHELFRYVLSHAVSDTAGGKESKYFHGVVIGTKCRNRFPCLLPSGCP